MEQEWSGSSCLSRWWRTGGVRKRLRVGGRKEGNPLHKLYSFSSFLLFFRPFNFSFFSLCTSPFSPSPLPPLIHFFRFPNFLPSSTSPHSLLLPPFIPFLPSLFPPFPFPPLLIPSSSSQLLTTKGRIHNQLFCLKHHFLTFPCLYSKYLARRAMYT